MSGLPPRRAARDNGPMKLAASWIALVVATGASLAPARAGGGAEPARAGGAAAHVAPAAQALSLPDVLAVAVRQSPELERAALDVDVARGRLDRAEGLEDVTIGVTAGYDRTRWDGATPEVTEARTATVSIRRALPTGGSIAVGASGAQTTDTPGATIPPAVSTVTLSLVQPLLRGLGTTAAREARHAASYELDAAARAGEARARDLVRAIVDGYWQVALARRQLEVRQASLALAQQQLAYTEGAIRTGKLAKSEQLAVEQVIALRRQDILAAELEVWERSLALRQLAGLEISADAIEIATTPLPAIPDAAIDLRAQVALAIEHSADLASLEAVRRAAQVRLDAARNRLLPQLDLAITGGPAGASTSLSGAVDKLAAGGGYTFGASVTLGYAIGRNDEHGLVTEARARAWRAKVDTRDARAQVILETARAVQLARTSLESVRLGERAIELATANIEAEQRKFEDRKSTNFEVLRRQDELEQAKLRHAVAIVDHLAARARLDELTGTILDKYKIKLRR